MASIEHRPDQDGMRAVVVLSVILGQLESPFTTQGYIGIDVFFVISGCLIPKTVSREMDAGSFSLLWFYERRNRRIFPALFATILAACIAGWFSLPPSDYAEFSESGWWAAASVSKIFYRLQD